MHAPTAQGRLAQADAPNILLIYPLFQAQSFWNFKLPCEVFGARHWAPPLGLMTVAALLPPHWNIRLVDCNVEPVTDADIDAADLVMTGGMLPQQPDTLALIERCQSRGKLVAVGGPDPTSNPHIYERADFKIFGEAEPVIDDFVKAFTNGARSGVFEAVKFTADVTKTPIPRFDLLRFSDYVLVNVQFSRGCPFNCEFCDIIELYGRNPRTKTNAQVLRELDALHALGHRGYVDFVDDNLIGNKKAVKKLLPELIAWQKAHDFPFEFSTEASMNLADDAELLRLMRDANFSVVFMGIESPDPETLVATQKKQNTRRDMAQSIHKVYDAGIYVLAGFILGFDTEKDGVADGMVECIEAMSLPVCMVGLLFALSNTQLTRRLQKEGRLHVGHEIATSDRGDQCTSGLNFETARPRRDILSDYVKVLREIYTPEAYFARVRHVAHALKRPRKSLRYHARMMRQDLPRFANLIRIAWREQPGVLPQILRTFADTLWHNPAAVKYAGTLMMLYLHLGPFSRYVIELIEQQIADIDRGAWRKASLAPAMAPLDQPASVAAE